MKTKEQLNADSLFAFEMALKGHKQFEWYNTINQTWVKTDQVRSHADYRIYHDIPEGWTRHDGEDWKGDKDAVIEEAIWCDGQRCATKGKKASWWSNEGEVNNFTTKPERRIYAYKLAEKKAEKKVIPWTVENFPRNLWVKRKGGDSEYLVIAACKEEGTLYLGGEWVNFYKLMSNYLQLDGSPCGTEVEQ